MDVKRTVLRTKIHFRNIQLHPIQLCAIVRRKHPGVGEMRRGWVRDGANVFEHFWLEAPDGTRIDPAMLSQAWPVELEYDVEKTDDAMTHPDSEELWGRRDNIFENWTKESRRALLKI